MAPLIKAVEASRTLRPIVVVTGQHREMLDQVNDLFGIQTDRDLDIMRAGASLTSLTAAALAGSGDALQADKPDAVVVQGDTSSAFAGALAGFLHKVPVIHLEAGLRTGSMLNPFPEEANRVLVGRLASLHLAPTARSKENLLAEGVDRTSIMVTGNTVIDALLESVKVPVRFNDPAVSDWAESVGRKMLVTAHRRESWGAPMAEAMRAVRNIVDQTPDVEVLLPAHRNSVVREVVSLAFEGCRNVRITEPLSYHEFVHAAKNSYLILTDSGGVQEEAPSLGVPVLVMRDTTERPEAVEAGTAKLIGTRYEDVYREVTSLLNDRSEWQAMANSINPYGDGRAAERSLSAIEQMLGIGQRMEEFGE